MQVPEFSKGPARLARGPALSNYHGAAIQPGSARRADRRIAFIGEGAIATKGSEYRKSDTNGVTTFEVTPATPPKSGRMLIIGAVFLLGRLPYGFGACFPEDGISSGASWSL